MHFSTWMLLAAAALPYITVGAAKSRRDYDNAEPRSFLASLQGWRARANWAHQNHFEAFPAFAAAVVVAQMRGMRQPTIDLLAGAFVAFRVAYTLAYVAGYASLRSVLWFLGVACVAALFVMG